MSTAPASNTASSNTTAKKRVLVVDDNRDSANTLAMLLKISGYETKTVGDGASALESTADFKPEVILLDIGLPDMSGYEVCKQLRLQTLDPRPRIVAVTGWSADDVQERAGDDCFDGHLAKPVDFKTLQGLIAG
jgi:CheY-like chemotaxis protein